MILAVYTRTEHTGLDLLVFDVSDYFTGDASKKKMQLYS